MSNNRSSVVPFKTTGEHAVVRPVAVRRGLQPAYQPAPTTVPQKRLNIGRVLLIIFPSVIIGSILINVAVNWWRVWQDDMSYGRPRTYQTDIDVGHGGESHFIVVNLEGHIFIHELPGLDPARGIMYSGPTLPMQGGDLIPAVISFKDYNGDGKLDMGLVVSGFESQWINDGSKFVERREP